MQQTFSRPGPTARSVNAAIAHFMDLNGVDPEHLADLLFARGLQESGQRLNPDYFTKSGLAENRYVPDVDVLMALAYILNSTPADMLTFVPPGDLLPDDKPLATGIPVDVCPAELRDWIGGRTGLDDDARMAWQRRLLADLEIRHAHLSEQLDAAAFDRPGAAWVRDYEYQLNQTDVASAMAERRLENLAEGRFDAE